VAVVASSNLGNLDTVVGVVRSVRAGQRKEISPLLAPRASSNVIASAVAIWFGCGGPNLMLCAGAPSGAEAVLTGALLLRAGRAARVIVVGAEPADEVAAGWHARRSPRAAPLREGSACVILEPAQQAAGTGGAVLIGPALAADTAVEHADLPAGWGDLYGAHGVAQTAVAATLAGRRAGPVRVVCGDPADGWRRLDVWPASGAS
jgi:3-oxoacyl-[acyl-carrier-protein] synthase II